MGKGAPQALLFSLLACSGTIDDSAAPAPPESLEGLTASSVKLLPFAVRLRRVAEVAGLSADNNALNTLKVHSLDLGAHDFATGVTANLQWDASKMVVW